MSHIDDNNELCNCDERECTYWDDDEAVCPDCNSDDIDLVCGDHGYKCNACGARFTCP